MAMAPSSPRLPSPPPPAEIQLGPKSPSGGPAATLQPNPIEQTLLDANSKRRIHPGTKAADMASGPPVVPLEKLDSPFQLQEHLAALHNRATHSGTHPLTRSAAQSLAQVPEGIDRTLWLYELCRFLISQCNTLIVGFLFDSPPCSANTCPEMRASEWQFLCAVHETPKSCCAIDYCCHTLDWAANVVTDSKIFPSRFMVQNDTQSKNAGLRNLVNVFRRLHRIFAHAWFQHRSVFWAVEGQSGLYIFFKAVCDTYDLLPAENYKLPPEAEGLETPAPEPQPEDVPPVILKNEAQQAPQRNSVFNFEDAGVPPPSRTNTRRHIRASPSTGSAVTTVMETEEDEGNGVARKLRELQISAPETVEEEPDSADVPVIVDQSGLDDAPTPTAGPDEHEAYDDSVSEADQTVVEITEDVDGDAEQSDEPVATSTVHFAEEESTEPTEAEEPAQLLDAAESKPDIETTADEEADTKSGPADAETSEKEDTAGPEEHEVEKPKEEAEKPAKDGSKPAEDSASASEPADEPKSEATDEKKE